MSSGNSSRGISLVAHRSEAPMFDKKTTLSSFAATFGLTMRNLPRECEGELAASLLGSASQPAA